MWLHPVQPHLEKLGCVGMSSYVRMYSDVAVSAVVSWQHTFSCSHILKPWGCQLTLLWLEVWRTSSDTDIGIADTYSEIIQIPALMLWRWKADALRSVFSRGICAILWFFSKKLINIFSAVKMHQSFNPWNRKACFYAVVSRSLHAKFLAV